MVIIGMVFILAVFLAYTLIGVGLFSFLYRFKNFWLLAKVFNLSTGFLSIGLGILATYDFYKFWKTHKTESLVLQLPAALKNRIHSIIGSHYRQSIELQRQETSRSHILRLVLSAFIVGFLISIHESVCTGQIYLPTIAFVLKTTPLKLQALGYLLLYNFMFIIPLLVILCFASLGATAGQFSNFLKKRIAVIKVFMAVLFFSLGIFLVFRA
jgi:cytochrome c biogenesis protein CcdA